MTREKGSFVYLLSGLKFQRLLLATCTLLWFYGHFARVTYPPFLERGMLYLKLACFGLWMKKRGILHLKRACFALLIIERGTLHLKRAK